MVIGSSYYGYFVGLFDILGFEERFKNSGLAKMLNYYEALIGGVERRNNQMNHIFGDLGFDEAPYWCANAEIAILSKTQGAYASDSILLWGNRTWPEARNKDIQDFKQQINKLDNGWQFHPIPCENFLNDCNELICSSLEVGLPLRGALSVGQAVLDKERNIYLGLPIIEAARLEKIQKFIGVSFCEAFMEQFIPKRFLLNFDKHLESNSQGGHFVLDWPRHWRKTRSTNLDKVISGLNKDSRYKSYYKNTFDLIAHSNKFSEQFESHMDTSIRVLYQEFSFSNNELSIQVRPVRNSKIR